MACRLPAGAGAGSVVQSIVANVREGRSRLPGISFANFLLRLKAATAFGLNSRLHGKLKGDMLSVWFGVTDHKILPLRGLYLNMSEHVTSSLESIPGIIKRLRQGQPCDHSGQRLKAQKQCNHSTCGLAHGTLCVV